MPASIEALIDRQLRRWEHERHHHASVVPESGEGTIAPQPVITVSRQHGSHGSELAARVAAHMGYTLLHRDVIDRISESTGYTRRLLAALEGRPHSGIAQWLDSMMAGRLVDESDYAIGLQKTIRSIAVLGGVVVVGRGANFITGLDAGFHVRIVAPREDRVATLMRRRHLTRAQALHEAETVDRERSEFIRRLVHRSVDDPLGYDVVLNEAGRSVETMTEIVLRLANDKFQRLHPPAPVVLRET